MDVLLAEHPREQERLQAEGTQRPARPRYFGDMNEFRRRKVPIFGVGGAGPVAARSLRVRLVISSPGRCRRLLTWSRNANPLKFGGRGWSRVSTRLQGRARKSRRNASCPSTIDVETARIARHPARCLSGRMSSSCKGHYRRCRRDVDELRSLSLTKFITAGEDPCPPKRKPAKVCARVKINPSG